MRNNVAFNSLVGKTLVDIIGSVGAETISFKTEDGEEYIMNHHQDCCESVSVEDICGELSDLIGSPIIQADEETSGENPAGVEKEYQDSFTWTFYRIATAKGQVVIRWYGESNGYYSESVNFEKL
jgi:hypothetical protein